MIAVIPSATLVGVAGQPVTVEVHVSPGLPGFTVVGLPDAAVRESRDRVRAALLSSGLTWPLRRVTVNLAPTSVRKGGAGLDLPIAVGLLVAAGELDPAGLDGVALIGELGLDGSVRHVGGMIALADAAGAPRLAVPDRDASEAAAVRPDAVVGVKTLRQLVRLIEGSTPWPSPAQPILGGTTRPGPDDGADLADVRGQALGRRALEVAAAGGHHLLMIGPPGSGKTMLAERLAGLLPQLGLDQAIEVTRIHSAAGVTVPGDGLVRAAPYRAPHHGASVVSLVGGGTATMRPGEISLAHHGVLFLDEMGEFAAAVLDALREPLEEGVVRVSRARATVSFPARFLLVGAMNPCPCGEGGPPGACRCSDSARARYARRLSAPLLDRFDLVVLLSRPDPDQLLSGVAGEPSRCVADRVASARALALARGQSPAATRRGADLQAVAPLTPAAAALLERHLRSGALSARGYDRVRRVARTIADLELVDGRDRHAMVTPAGSAPAHLGVAPRHRGDRSVPSAGTRGGEDMATTNGRGATTANPTEVAERHVAEALALRAARSLVMSGTR